MTEKEINKKIELAIKNFQGQLPELEKAIGAYYVGKHMGRKPLLLIHDKRTLKKYEQILKLDFKEVMPDVGEYAKKSLAWRAVQKVSSFWKAVNGEYPGLRTTEVK